MRYDNIVSQEHKKQVLKGLYGFMGIPSSNGHKSYTLENPWDDSEHRNWHPYSLTRGEDFDPNHWKEELKGKVLHLVSYIRDSLYGTVGKILKKLRDKT